MRIVADIVLLLAALYLPWWLTMLLAAALFFLFERFYELFAVALYMDLLYGTPTHRFFGFQFVLSFFGAVLFLLLLFLKRRMRV